MSTVAAWLCFLFVYPIGCDVSNDSGNLTLTTPDTANVAVVPEKKPKQPFIDDYVVIPHKISNKISTALWERAIEMRPLLLDVVSKEFPENPSLWLGVMISLATQESGLDCDAESYAGAVGCFQFIKKTANAMGATDCRDLGPVNRRDVNWAALCGARLLKQNIKIVKVNGDDCQIVGIGALRPYNEGVGWTQRARKKAKNPDDLNSVAKVNIKSKSNELQTDRYSVYILGKWLIEYKKSNYFTAVNPCRSYIFDKYGVKT